MEKHFSPHKLRDAMGQAKLADPRKFSRVVKISPASLYNYLNGVSEPSAIALGKLSVALSIPIDELFVVVNKAKYHDA